MLSKKSILETVRNKGEISELLTLQEASDILKCHPNTLHQ